MAHRLNGIAAPVAAASGAAEVIPNNGVRQVAATFGCDPTLTAIISTPISKRTSNGLTPR